MKSYEKIFTDQKLPDTFSEYLTMSLDNNDLVIYGSGLGNEDAFIITVSEVVAFHVYEEFCHSDMDRPKQDAMPPYSNESKAIYYPALEIINSSWIDSFSENRLRDHQREGARHFQFLSYSSVIDVISYQDPTAKSILNSEYEKAKEVISAKFT
jgi:hypothetical protein